MADLVLWNPSFFGVKPDLIMKGGFLVEAAMGDPNASISTPQPVLSRPMFAAYGRAPFTTSVTFLSQAGIDRQIPEALHLQKRVVPVRNCRSINKRDHGHHACSHIDMPRCRR